MAVSVFDVATYILKKCGVMSTMKLQKLVYYAQAWSLVWDEEPLFKEKIRAWANGPIVRELFDAHQGMFKVSHRAFDGKPAKLSADQRETADAVIKYYGTKDPQWLSDLTHAEDPWRNARRGLPEGERGNAEITNKAMYEYYSSL